MDRRDAIRGYYDAIDAGDYDRLHALLVAEFVQERPDRTLAGREAFVRFMRDERPRTDTEHVIETACVSDDADGDDVATAFARGRLLGGDGETLFGFVDVHRVGAEGIESLTTYTDCSSV